MKNKVQSLGLSAEELSRISENINQEKCKFLPKKKEKARYSLSVGKEEHNMVRRFCAEHDITMLEATNEGMRDYIKKYT